MNQVKLTDVIGPSFYGFFHDVRRPDVTEAWAKGGRGSLKSSTISALIELGMIEDPDANALVFRRYENELRDTVVEQMKLTAHRLQIADKFKFIASPFQATYMETGQKILFRGADNPAKLKSITLEKGYIKYVWFEEVDQFGGMEEIRNILQSVFRGTDQKQIAFYSFNPPRSARSWANFEAKVQKKGRIVHHSDYRSVPKEWLGERFIADAEHLREVNEQAYRHEYLGEEVGTGLEVFNNVKLETITDEQIKSFDRIYQGLDFGYAADPLAFERMHYDATRRKLYIFYEIAGHGISNRLFAERLPDEYKRLETVADSAEPKSISELRSDYGLRIRGARKGPGSVEYGIKWLGDLEQIVIDPVRCPLASKEFVNYSLEVRRDGSVVEKYPDKNNHAIDSVRYALEDVQTKKMSVPELDPWGA